jgi:hypothetical protein
VERFPKAETGDGGEEERTEKRDGKHSNALLLLLLLLLRSVVVFCARSRLSKPCSAAASHRIASHRIAAAGVSLQSRILALLSSWLLFLFLPCSSPGTLPLHFPFPAFLFAFSAWEVESFRVCVLQVAASGTLLPEGGDMRR